MIADILIKPLEDETLYSLVGRLGKINGYRNDLTCQLLLGSHNDLRVADSEVSFGKFSEATKMHYGKSEDILQRFTNYNFRNALTTPLTYGGNSNKWYKNISSGKVSLATLSNFEEHKWKWCPKCLERDLILKGFSYWRIKHQLPGVLVCLKHATLLEEIIIPFRCRQKSFFSPSSLPSSLGKKTSPAIFLDLALASSLSNISVEIQNFTHINQSLLRKTLKIGLVNKGMINKAGTIQPDACVEFGKYFHRLNEIKGIELFSKPKIFNKSVSSLLFGKEIYITRPLIMPMVILWLYGNWQLFINVYQWELIMLTEKLPEPAETLQINIVNRLFYRNICKLFILDFPESKRKDFWKLNPKSCRWLNTYDTIWFKKTLPPNTRTISSQLNLF